MHTHNNRIILITRTGFWLFLVVVVESVAWSAIAEKFLNGKSSSLQDRSEESRGLGFLSDKAFGRHLELPRQGIRCAEAVRFCPKRLVALALVIALTCPILLVWWIAAALPLVGWTWATVGLRPPWLQTLLRPYLSTACCDGDCVKSCRNRLLCPLAHRRHPLCVQSAASRRDLRSIAPRSRCNQYVDYCWINQMRWYTIELSKHQASRFL